MTDFFTSLVDRALDRTPVLERRQPTLFEPSVGTAAGLGEQSNAGIASPLQENEIVVDSSPVSNAPKAEVKNPSRPLQLTSREEPDVQPVEAPSTRRRRFHDRSQPQSDPEEAQPATTSFATLRETHVEEPKHEPTPTIVAKPREITVAPLTTIETIVERRVEREVVTERSTETPEIKEVHTLAQSDLHAKPSSYDTAAEQKQLAKTEATPPQRPKEQTAIKPVAEKKAITRKDSTPILRALSRAESRQPTKQAPMPAIHVTIGRVEVRATQPAASKPRVAQPVGPKLSLEDYLRSRGKEK